MPNYNELVPPNAQNFSVEKGIKKNRNTHTLNISMLIVTEGHPARMASSFN